MFKSIIISVTLLAASAFAQDVYIALPTQGAVVKPGEHVTISLHKPNSLSPSPEVGLVVGIQSCTRKPCRPASEVMGTILYNGPYNPQYHEPALPPYQNITVQIPKHISSGCAHLNVMHVNLLGGGPEPYFQTLNKTVTIT